VQLLLDGSDSNTANHPPLGYAEGLLAGYSRRVQEDAQRPALGGPVTHGGVDARIRVWYKPGTLVPSGEILLIVPGLIAVVSYDHRGEPEVRSPLPREMGKNGHHGSSLLSTPGTAGWKMALGKLSAYFVLGNDRQC